MSFFSVLVTDGLIADTKQNYVIDNIKYKIYIIDNIKNANFLL